MTDSGREIVHAPDKPGVSNLIEIMSVATGESIGEIQARYDGQGYGAFKEDVAEAVERAVSSGAGGTVELETDDGRITIVVSQVVYLKRFTKGSQPGFAAY